MADDEFVLGFCDSEWTGIAPMLEEDVAFSLSQDEIGHARLWYEMLAQLTDDTADHIAYGRQPNEYHHADLVDHPRTDWAFTIARRWLYETADSVRLGALTNSSWPPLADIVAKVRREEKYHLLHMDLWLRRTRRRRRRGPIAARRGARPTDPGRPQCVRRARSMSRHSSTPASWLSQCRSSRARGRCRRMRGCPGWASASATWRRSQLVAIGKTYHLSRSR